MREYIIGVFLCVMLLSSCDEGRIYEKEIVTTEEGRAAKLTAEVTGIGTWPQGYSVVIAGFSASSSYAVTSKNISASSQNGEKVTVTMGGINDEVKTIEICAINSLRKRIVTFASIEPEAGTDTIRIDEGTLDVSMYSAIQKHLFNVACASCHGAGAGGAGGNMHLTEGQSYADIYDVPSHKLAGVKRVEPGNATGSLLYQAVATDISSTGWHYDHSTMMNASPELVTLLADWINNGALQ